jgi:hypothetical protein
MRRPAVYPLSFFVPFLVFVFLHLPAARGAEAGGYREALQESARRLGLADDRYWDILLHYKPGLLGRRKSLVDDPRFFLSPKGKSDPHAELAATIDGLFDDERDERLAPRCRFPARFAWLEDRLSFDASRLPPVSCPDLESKLSQIDARSAFLIFASGHMNAPASMFGHTLLRFDSTYESPLLAYAVNYAATVDPRDGGFAYAFKGIFGFYPGYYSILPYFDKVKEYRNMDQRDMWEYRLHFTEAEVRRIILHVMELQDIYSDYYFFKENCSYNLLFLLEAGSPEASLTDRFSVWTIPADTLKAAIDAGLAAEPVYRPSRARRIRHIAALLDERGTALARAVLDGNAVPEDVLSAEIPGVEQARVLELASEVVQHRYAKRRLSQEAFQRQFLGILSARSRIAGAGEEVVPPVPVPARPETGHDSSRAAAGGGIRDDRWFLELAFRPAYHDLLDADDGYTPGSQIDFLSGALRYYPEAERLRLQRLDLVRIFSLAERDAFFRPISWKVSTGFETKTFASGDDRLAYVLSPGGGFAWKRPLPGLVFVMVETALGVSGAYDADYAAAVGASAGILKQVTRSWKALLTARGVAGVAGDKDRGTELRVSLEQGFRIGRRSAIFLEAARTEYPNRDFGFTEAKVSWNIYF